MSAELPTTEPVSGVDGTSVPAEARAQGPGRPAWVFVLVRLALVIALALAVPWLVEVARVVLDVRMPHATVAFVLAAVYVMIFVERALDGRTDDDRGVPFQWLPRVPEGAIDQASQRSFDVNRMDETNYPERLETAARKLRDSEVGETRSAGARDISRLADEWPEGRQECVDVLCAYLRKPVALDDGVPSIVQRAIIDRLRRRRTASDDDTEAGEERPVVASWSDLSLDLRGAVLVDWDSSYAVIPGRTDFSHAIFAGDTWFRECEFLGPANFTGAVFEGCAIFESVTVSGGALFKEALFKSRAEFDFAGFAERAFFPRARFWQRADFNVASFEGPADFQGVEFRGDTSFDGATFTSCAGMTGSRFRGTSSFYDTTFGRANFNRALFPPSVSLQDARFLRPAESRFNGVSGLSSAEVEWLTSKNIKVVPGDATV